MTNNQFPVRPRIACERLVVVTVAMLTAAAASSCCDSADRRIDRAGSAMDDVSVKLEEYGTLSISAPVFAAPADGFKFDLTTGGADTYFRDAKTNVQGQSAVFTQTSQSFSFGASAQIDPTQIAAYNAAKAQYTHDQNQYQGTQNVSNQRNAALLQAADRDRAAAYAAADITAKTDPIQAEKDRAAADRAYANATKDLATGTPPTYPTAKTDGSDVPAAPTGLAKQPTDALATLSDPKFQAFLKLLPDTGPTLADRTALITAAGDRATEAIFKTLGDPAAASQFKDKLVVFGVSMVSVNPGWRTRQGYQADISVLVHYKNEPARADVLSRFLADESVPLALRKRVALDSDAPPPGGPAGALVPGAAVADRYLPIPAENYNPTLAAVSPMTETEVLDLSASDRRMDQLAINLSFALRYAGLGVQAQAFEQFVKSRQQDTRTRTSTTAVNAYSEAGGLFGFQVGPRLTAIEDPTRKNKSAPANVLDRQSFPILVLIGFEKDDLRPRVLLAGGRYQLVEPTIVMNTANRWLPLDRSNPRLTESDHIRVARTLTSAISGLGPTNGSPAAYADTLAIYSDLAARTSAPNPDREIAYRIHMALRQVTPALVGNAYYTALQNFATAYDTAIVTTVADRSRTDALLNQIEKSRAARLADRAKKLDDDLKTPPNGVTPAAILNTYVADTQAINGDADTEAAAALAGLDARTRADLTAIQPVFDQLRAAANPTVRRSIAARVEKSDPNVVDGTTARAIRERATSLEYKLFGGNWQTFAPLDYVIAAAPSTAPKVTDVFPSTVVLRRTPAGPLAPQVVQVVLVGSNLKNLNTDAAVTAATTVVGNAALNGGAASIKVASDSACVVSLNITNTGGIAFQLPVKNSKDLVLTPMLNAVPDAPPALLYQRSTATTGGPVTSETISVDPALAPDIVKAEIERLKNVPGANAAVNVQVHSNK